MVKMHYLYKHTLAGFRQSIYNKSKNGIQYQADMEDKYSMYTLVIDPVLRVRFVFRVNFCLIMRLRIRQSAPNMQSASS